MSDMKKENEKIDELLNNTPKFTDHRSKEEVYNRVKMEIEAQVKEEKRKIIAVSFSKWMPFIVSVAAILLLTFLVSSYTNQKETTLSKDSVYDNAEPKENMRSMEKTEESAKVIEETKADQANAMTTMSMITDSTIELIPLQKAVYEDSVNGGTVFHFSLIENALSVPITIIISQERMEADFPGMTPTSLQLYERYASQIDEEALGFMEYHPYKGYFVAEDKQLKHYLPANHGYDVAPGTSAPYWSSINEIFTDFETLLRVNEDGTAIEWDQVGIINEPSPLFGEYAQQSYFLYTALNGDTYLSSNFGKRFNTLSEAFENMRSAENDIYTSVIPNNVTYSYRDNNGIATIYFDEPFDLKTMDSKDATRMMEAFALTAASFGKEVKVENVVQQQWEEFDLTKPLPVPVGPNGFIMSDE
ncbi:hypothetical protein ACIQYS_11110 [Psychrobacillus sp. NPDC096426]|uniref:hypothetical protein n=1 Tax=Psychrobacillus sp. NPDC096426 TaxID=3364491 RepID=UPI0037F44AF0